MNMFQPVLQNLKVRLSITPLVRSKALFMYLKEYTPSLHALRELIEWFREEMYCRPEWQAQTRR